MKSLKQGLAAIYDFQLDLAAKIKQFAQYVEKDLIKNELSKLLIDYDVRVNNCITRIDAIKKELDEHNNLSIKSFKEYINVFHEMEILVSNG